MQSVRRLEGRKAVVTGACQGIGRAIAEAFAAQGADLFLLDRQPEIPAALLENIANHGVRCGSLTMDVTRPEQVESAMAQAEEFLGGLEILVNNAGVHHNAGILEETLEAWQGLINVNVHGVFLCTQAALRRMQPGSQGRIINLASIAGRRPSPYQSAYNTSKHAVIGFTRCTALEAAPQGITVNAICPGLIDTDMFEGVLAGMGKRVGNADPEAFRAEMLRGVPLGRMIQPEEVAQLAVFLASGESGGITGQALPVDGGRVMA